MGGHFNPTNEAFTEQPRDIQPPVVTAAKAPKPLGVHVVLLLHLPRGETEGEQRYCVDFDTRWKFSFVDSIFSADALGLPDVEV
jgi:hypothetical protein